MAPHATDSINEVADRTECLEFEKKGNQSLPFHDPCLSYWHRMTRAFRHLHSNSGAPVPPTSTYVVIGSGLSGSLTAYTLVQDHNVPASSILILEAREAVSGASGRNAGHVRPDSFRGFSAYARIHGVGQARKIIENEKKTFEALAEFVKENEVKCDFHETTTFDVCLTPESAEYERESLEAYKNAGGDVSHVKVYAGDEAATRTKVAGAFAAYEWAAGSSHPAKLCQYLLTDLIEKGVKLWTHCPATEVTEHVSSSDHTAKWEVHTPRGVVATKVVVHCTNAYAAHLLPELATFVTPNRAQAHSFVPTRSLTGSDTRTSTLSLRYDLRHFFSFIQRQEDGAVIFGVSRENPEWSREIRQSIVSFDDTAYNVDIAATTDRAFRQLFPESESKITRHGEGAEHAWSGIIAMTPDSIPMVGAIEGKRGQFILAGHNGHGMARIWTCAPALAKLIEGQPWEKTGLPECFEYSRSKLGRAEKQNVKSLW